jgi:hypothetical protein
MEKDVMSDFCYLYIRATLLQYISLWNTINTINITEKIFKFSGQEPLFLIE